jgi:hypothetical protein
MRFKLASEHDGRTFVLILDQGEEALAAITVDGTAADQDQERHRADHRQQCVPGIEDDRGGVGRGPAGRHARTATTSTAACLKPRSRRSRRPGCSCCGTRRPLSSAIVTMLFITGISASAFRKRLICRGLPFVPAASTGLTRSAMFMAEERRSRDSSSSP